MRQSKRRNISSFLLATRCQILASLPGTNSRLSWKWSQFGTSGCSTADEDSEGLQSFAWRWSLCYHFPKKRFSPAWFTTHQWLKDTKCQVPSWWDIVGNTAGTQTQLENAAKGKPAASREPEKGLFTPEKGLSGTQPEQKETPADWLWNHRTPKLPNSGTACFPLRHSEDCRKSRRWSPGQKANEIIASLPRQVKQSLFWCFFH